HVEAHVDALARVSQAYHCRSVGQHETPAEDQPERGEHARQLVPDAEPVHHRFEIEQPELAAMDEVHALCTLVSAARDRNAERDERWQAAHRHTTSVQQVRRKIIEPSRAELVIDLRLLQAAVVVARAEKGAEARSAVQVRAAKTLALLIEP